MICALCHASGADIECMVCKAPHHQDCWDYNKNVCSIFACGSRHSSLDVEDFQKTYKAGLQATQPRRKTTFTETIFAAFCWILVIFYFYFV